MTLMMSPELEGLIDLEQVKSTKQSVICNISKLGSYMISGRLLSYTVDRQNDALLGYEVVLELSLDRLEAVLACSSFNKVELILDGMPLSIMLIDERWLQRRSVELVGSQPTLTLSVRQPDEGDK